MAWTDDDERPSLTRDELLTRVRDRGTALRRRRRIGRALASALAVLAVLGGTGLVMRSDGQERSVQVATDGPSTTGGDESLPELLPGAPEQALPTPGPPVLPPPSTLAQGPPASPPPPGIFPPPRAPSGSTVTPAPVSPITSTTVAQQPVDQFPPRSAPKQPRCQQDQLAIAVAVDKAEYGPGEMVRLTSTVRNQTSVLCYRCECYDFGASFEGADGRTAGFGSDVLDGEPDLPMAPGATMIETVDWDRRTCSGADDCSPAQPGDYKVTVRWHVEMASMEATTFFRLLA